MTCKDCKERHLGCHGTCQLYAEYKKELDEKNAKRRAIKDEEREYRRAISKATYKRTYG